MYIFVSCAKAFLPRCTRVAAEVCGLWLPSLTRRPHWHMGSTLINFVAHSLAKARLLLCQDSFSSDLKRQALHFGKGFMLDFRNFRQQLVWQPAVLLPAVEAATRDIVIARAVGSNNDDGANSSSDSSLGTQTEKCFFGHGLQSRYRQRFLCAWRNVPFNGLLCGNCWNTAKKDTNHY